MMKRFRWPVLLALCLFGLYLSGDFWLPGFCSFLDVSDSPQHADFIVLLGGSGPNRALKAAALYRQGYAPRVLVSGGPLYRYGIDCSTAQLALDDLQRLGLPAEAILLNDEASSTWDEAQQLLQILRREGAQSALIVTDPVHTRRVRATYRRLQADRSIELTFVGAEAVFPTHTWWRSEKGLIAVQNEYVKLGYYLLYRGVWPWYW